MFASAFRGSIFRSSPSCSLTFGNEFTHRFPIITQNRYKKELVIDEPTKLFREKARRKKYFKKTNKETGRPYNYYWRYPLLRFNKHYHTELENLIKSDQIAEVDKRFKLLRQIGKHPSPHVVEMLSGVYVRKNRVNEVYDLMKTLDDDTHKITRNTFRNLAVGHFRNNDLEKVESAFDSLLKTYPEANKYNSSVFGAHLAYLYRTKDEEKFSFWLDQYKIYSTQMGENQNNENDFGEFLKEIPLDMLEERFDLFFSLLSEFNNESTSYDLLAYRFASEGSLKGVESIISLFFLLFLFCFIIY